MITLFIFYIFAIAAASFFITDVMDGIREKVKASVEAYLKGDGASLDAKNELKAFMANAALDTVEPSVRFLPKIIGILELSIFSVVTFLLLLTADSYYDVITAVGVMAAGWFAIKAVGSFQQWSSPIIGRAVFYTFLIGTLLSVGAGIVIGIVFSLPK